MSFTRISIIVVLAALAVYFGLTYLLPHQKENLTNASGPTPDEVFASNTSATSPAQPDSAAVAAAAATPAASASAPAEPSSEASKDTAMATSSEPPKDSSMQTASTAAAETASSTAPAEQAAAVTNAPSGSSNEPAEASDQGTAGSTSTDSTAGMMTASPIKRHSHSKAAATSEVASSEGAEPVKSTRHSRHAKSSKTVHYVHNEFGDDAMYAWWPAADKQNSSRLQLVYGGEAAYAPAIVLLFSSELSDATAAGSHVQVFDRQGTPITQSWSLGNNPKMLVMKDVKPGRYTVVVGPEVADAQGKSLGTKLFGPVYVH